MRKILVGTLGLGLLLSHNHVTYADSEASTATPVPDQEHVIFSRAPVQQTRWAVKPTIRVCVSSGVTRTRVEKAMKFWQDLGYEFDGLLIVDINSRPCHSDLMYFGEIVITLPDQTFNMSHALGTTRVWFDTETNEITKANIQIMTQWTDSERILEHELGHALGWLDVNQTGHIMNHNWSLGGLNTTGVEYNREP